MSEGEDFVRRTWARWNDGDRELLEEEIDPEVTIHSALSQAVYRGYEGVERWMREIDEQFSDWRVALDSVDEPRDGIVIARGSISMRGRQSGLDLTQPASWIIELRDGRMLTLRNFVGTEAAAEFQARGS
jgi:ketosteroid isomerase-like protein